MTVKIKCYSCNPINNTFLKVMRFYDGDVCRDWKLDNSMWCDGGGGYIYFNVYK